MDFNLDNVSGTVTHPNFLEIKLFVRQPNDVEKMEYFTSLGSFVVPVAVMNPKDDTVVYEPSRNDDGSIKTYKNSDEPILQPVIKDLQSLPVGAMVKFLKMITTGWAGFKNKGVDIPYSEKVVHLLFSPKLNITKADGETEPFWMHAINQVLEDKTFDPDPLENV